MNAKMIKEDMIWRNLIHRIELGVQSGTIPVQDVTQDLSEIVNKYVARNARSIQKLPGVKQEGDAVSRYTLIMHPQQWSMQKQPTGHDVYAWLMQTYQLEHCIDLVDLQWWVEHQNEIPKEFTHKLIFAWGSVTFDDDRRLLVPYLVQDLGKSRVAWQSCDHTWMSNCSACIVDE